ncbi:MAG: tRNA (N6-threonylcarbamoyladenosine(37)-N6)-methyltransferase TrmO [Clostridia bacterium]|nr:tRNA (N6-threonylcarbamoyladenosine(37)-N6)-methyltransferase TrmO [Clostridia bacterium]
MNILPIAYVKTEIKGKFGVPRQSGRVKSLLGEIIFYPPYNDADAVRDIEQFSHLWLIFDFSLNHKDAFSPLVRPPRLGGNKKVGVFASRSSFRPNNLGLSCVKLEKVIKNGNTFSLLVSGVDLADGTPIYDVKPYLNFSDAIPDAKCGYAEENKDHLLKVVFDEKIFLDFPKDKLPTLIGCIAEDPRPSYQNDDRVYAITYLNFDVSFTVSGDVATIIGVKKL